MDRRTADAINEKLDRLMREYARVQTGLVIDDSPLSVSVGDNEHPILSPKIMDGWTPAVNDTVIVLRWQNSVAVFPVV